MNEEHFGKKEMMQCWIALFLTAGEFSVGIFLVFYEGHYLVLYLALTYLMRETTGGKHYHVIVQEQWQKLRSHKNETRLN